ncbi:hypothetical protein [Marinomonas sp. IMCC 4694]|uniref:hypothetical protein n=1 Tax=Marinomonas sp. IMCC 4694 TaxID=2605432 RepID=UPI0011E87A8E|nr:hypothetical protein [Marinomonas sp. IMCC 4694]TYL49218.1 hypothetical protein FXV75_15620 [Marinomonas sp. IMCC 4694]
MSQLIKISLVSAMFAASVQVTTVQANEPDVTGTWQLQDAEGAQATLDQAVENVAQEMNFFIRALARPALKKQTQICTQWQLSRPTSPFRWQCDRLEADVISLDAQKVLLKTDEEGVAIFATYQQTSDSVVVILESERGKRTNTWQRLGENELRYTAMLESEKLPTPLTWTLTYTK